VIIAMRFSSAMDSVERPASAKATARQANDEGMTKS
jgi:hypothetical protein